MCGTLVLCLWDGVILHTQKIVTHGLSLGGALAATIASLYPEVCLTVDQTFTNAYEVALEVANDKFDGYAPAWAVSSVVSTTFPRGLTAKALNGMVMCTDGYNVEVRTRVRERTPGWV